MIDSPDTAAEAALQWITDAFRPAAGAARIIAVADLGSQWRVFFTVHADALRNRVSRMPLVVDKATGDVSRELPIRDIAPNAEDAYRTMLDTQIRPGLQALGFHGTAEVYDLAIGDDHAVVDFQLSDATTFAVAMFTINIRLISSITGPAWSTEQPHQPPTHHVPSPSIWSNRLGELTPRRIDWWWAVFSGIRTDDTADEVLAAIDHWGLPTLRNHSQT